jgi:hypothetical protein
MVWDYHKSLMILAEQNKVQLLYVPVHNGIEGNMTANRLARKGSLCPFIGPEPVCGISERCKACYLGLGEQEHQKYLQSTPRQRHANGHLPKGLLSS